MRVSRPVSNLKAYGMGALGMASYSFMDALMKGLSLAIGTYSTVLWRTLLAATIAGVIFVARGSAWPRGPALRVHVVRGILSGVCAFLFFWGLARVPLAQTIALAFVAPLISLYLAALLLGETIGRPAVLASLGGLAGVLVILAGQAQADLGREALFGSFAVLASAGLYAWNIILMRQQAQIAQPLEVAFFTSLVMAVGYLPAAPWFTVAPQLDQLLQLVGAATLFVLALWFLSWAYARAEAQYLAPVEYTQFIWGSALGWIFFAEPLRPLTLIGAALIVIGCYYGARSRSNPLPGVEAGV